MKLIKIVSLCMLLLITASGTSFSQTGKNRAMKPIQSGYAPVNGIKVYYEVYGEGKPLLLLHGSFMTINTNYRMLIPELSKTRKVIAIEFQGHGRTADTDRPFSIENFADDAAGALKFLKIDSADVFGYSLGGIVALNLAIRHPEVTKKLILASSVFKYDGWSEETRAVFPIIKPEFFEHTPIKQAYDSLAPDPKHWTVFVAKMVKLVSTPYDFTGQAKKINNPVLFIMGDADGIMPEHVAEMFRIAGGGQNGDLRGLSRSQLAVLPGTAHTALFEHTGWILAMMKRFLNP